MLSGLIAPLDFGDHALAAFAADGGYIPSDDAVSLEAGGAYLIDVLANDVGLPEKAGEGLLILTAPACGEAWRDEGMVAYSVDPGCSGTQVLTYCVPSGDGCPSATLSVEVVPNPSVSTSGGDPTLTAGGAARDFTAESATPQFGMDDGGFVGGLPSPMGGGLPSVGTGGLAAVAPPPPSAAAEPPSAASEPAAAPDADPAPSAGGLQIAGFDEGEDAAVPALPSIAAVTPGQKRRKPRSVYASPAIDAPGGDRPRRPAGAEIAVAAPRAGSSGRVVSAPPERIRLTQNEALRRNAPDQPDPADGSATLRPLGQVPAAAPYAFLSWSALLDHERGAPAKQPISPLAEFRELVSLSDAPAADWTLPEPEAMAQVAALWGMNSGWVVSVMRDSQPAAGGGLSMEPLAGLIARKPVISTPDGFYQIVSLDPHGRHMRLTPHSSGAAPRAEPRPADQAAEPSEPAPDYLAAASGAPTPAAPAELTSREARPEPVAFRASAAQTIPMRVSALSVDLPRPALPTPERTQPIPPELDGWTPVAADMPPLRLTVNLTISGARDMPVRVRRGFATLAAQTTPSIRLALLDQRPGDLSQGERTEPLPLNLRRLRTFPPLLSQQLRLTPDVYGAGLPRGGSRMRRYAELAPLGAAARPFAAFEPGLSPRGAALPDPNPPGRREALLASLETGAGPAIAASPLKMRRPFEAAPAPAAALWPETGQEAPWRAAAAAPGAPSASRQGGGAMTLASLSAQEPEPGAAPIGAGAAPDCPMVVSAFPASGGMIQFEASSTCRAGRVAVLHIEDLRIALRFDAQGEIAATIPGLARDHFLELVAEDGETAQQPITLLDIGGVRRVALSWDDPIDLNLHAWEFGAAHGDEGHLWEGAETDERAYRRGVRGMVSSFPSLDGQGSSVEFYSFNPGRRSPVGRIALAVEYATRGRTPQAPYCDGGTLASPEYRVHGFDDGVMNDGVKRIFESVPCGTTLGDDDLYLRDLAQDILIVGR